MQYWKLVGESVINDKSNDNYEQRDIPGISFESDQYDVFETKMEASVCQNCYFPSWLSHSQEHD